MSAGLPADLADAWVRVCRGKTAKDLYRVIRQCQEMAAHPVEGDHWTVGQWADAAALAGLVLQEKHLTARLFAQIAEAEADAAEAAYRAVGWLRTRPLTAEELAEDEDA